MIQDVTILRLWYTNNLCNYTNYRTYFIAQESTEILHVWMMAISIIVKMKLWRHSR